jgi:glycosyltransferase involved in cell wall biosynthesis
MYNFQIPIILYESGWPWDHNPPKIPPTMPDGSPWPKISIVTPSFNQAEFIEETIRSVLLQGYPNLEYIIIDGGSTDGSVDIIKKYEPWLTSWVSEPDRGQSHAINKGLDKTTGDLIAYICSDDIYLPDVLSNIAETYLNHHDYSMFTGGIINVYENKMSIDNINAFPRLPIETPTDLTLIDHEKWFLPQPSSFFTKKILEKVGKFVREDLHYTMDRELIYRVAKSGKVMLIDQLFATYRHHSKSKTTAFVFNAFSENKNCFNYCDWGGKKDKKKRKRVMYKRIAQGYWHKGKYEPNFFLMNLAFINAIRLNPGYILKKKFIKSYVKKILLYER